MNGLAVILILIPLTADKNVEIASEVVIEAVGFLNAISNLDNVSLLVTLSDIDLNAVNSLLTEIDTVIDSDILLNGS